MVKELDKKYEKKGYNGYTYFDLGYEKALKDVLKLIDDNTNFLGGWKVTPKELKQKLKGGKENAK